MKHFRNCGLLAGVLLCATVALLWAGTTAQVMYIATPLMLVSNGEYSGVSVLNNQGQAAGWADTGPTDNIRHPFLYTGGSMIDLGTFGGGSWNGANGLNNLGQVVGAALYSDNEQHAFLYTGGGLIDLTPDNSASKANAINDSGQVVGVLTNAAGRNHAFIYSGGTLTELGAADNTRNTQAYGINAIGEIWGLANNYTAPGGAYGWFYSNGIFKNMFLPCNNNCSSVNAMNNNGQVVGGVGGNSVYPFLYNGRTGVMTDLSSASNYPGHGGTANAINDNGQVVGYLLEADSNYEVGFIYGGGTYTYLNAFATAPNGSNWNEPQTINILGQVGGRALGSDGNWHGFVYSHSAMTDINLLVSPTLGVNFHNVSHINDSGLLIATTANSVDYLLTPVLSVASTHSGSFTPGQQNATYTLKMTNAATAPATNRTVAVTELLPAALTFVSMAGPGWDCSGGRTCTRGNSIAAGASYPDITVTVNVAAGATSPQINRASVSEAGVQLGAATDSTVIQSLGASTVTAANATIGFSHSNQNVTLTATVTTAGGAINGGTVSFTVSGIGTVTSGTVTGGNASAVLTVGGGVQVGSYSINAVYSGTTGIAGSSDATKSLTISLATPVLSWSNPPDIQFGSALGSGQLNATASVPGIFAYSPTAGTVLPSGSNKLTVFFTPLDAVDYALTSASVLVNVVAPPVVAGPRFSLTRTLSRDSSNNLIVTVYLTNIGGQPQGALTTFPSASLWSAKIGTTPAWSTFNGVFTCNGGVSNCPIAPGSTAQAEALFLPSPGPSLSAATLTLWAYWELNICPGGVPVPGCYWNGFVGGTSRILLP